MSASTARPAAAAPSTQLAVQIHSAISNKLQRFNIRLEPAELGRIDVRLEFARDGQVRAQIAVERPETLDLLQKDVQGLERALRDAGTNADKLNLSFDLRDQSRQGGAQAEKGADSSDQESAGDAQDPAAETAEQPIPGRRVDALVDIHV